MSRTKILITIICIVFGSVQGRLPIVISTWAFQNATKAAWSVLKATGNPLEALVEGCTTCEIEQCDFTVGFGGSPDETGETTLESMIMDGSNLNMGAVADLRNVKSAVKVAKHVLLNTAHSIIAGNQATDFALKMGFKMESLNGKHSNKEHIDWIKNKCQPNFWNNVLPDPKTSCGPYKAKDTMNYSDHNQLYLGNENHDTIGMIVIDDKGNIFAGTSTNGLSYKIPGRVGDSVVPGGGAYCNNEYGAAVATGNGDIMMRHLPTFLAVELMRNGLSAKEAADEVMKRMVEKDGSQFFGGIIVVDRNGNYAAACNKVKGGLPISVADKSGQRLEKVTCFDGKI